MFRIFKVPSDGANWRCVSCDKQFPADKIIKVLKSEDPRANINQCLDCFRHYQTESTAAWEKFAWEKFIDEHYKHTQ